MRRRRGVSADAAGAVGSAFVAAVGAAQPGRRRGTISVDLSRHLETAVFLPVVPAVGAEAAIHVRRSPGVPLRRGGCVTALAVTPGTVGVAVDARFGDCRRIRLIVIWNVDLGIDKKRQKSCENGCPKDICSAGRLPCSLFK